MSYLFFYADDVLRFTCIDIMDNCVVFWTVLFIIIIIILIVSADFY